jgi:hypothetical protein
MVSIQKQVEEYINQHNSIKDCFKKGLINYSALSRQIITKLKLKEQNFDAVLIACRRYTDQLKHINNESKILKLLKKSQLKIRTKVCRIILDSKVQLFDNIIPLHLIQGDSSITILANSDDYIIIKNKYENYILDSKEDLAEIIIISPKSADKTIGLTGFLSNLLSDANINFQTVLGSYIEDIFIIKNTDLSKTLVLLNKLI